MECNQMTWKIYVFSICCLIWGSFVHAKNITKAEAQNLRVYVEQVIGPMQYARNYKHVQELNRTAAWLSEQMRLFGLQCHYQNFNVNQQQYRNVVCRLNSNKTQKIIVGAHYDVEGETVGINHNATGVASVIETARILSTKKNLLSTQIEFVFYSLNAAPFLNNEQTGSYRHARSLLEKKESIRAAYILDQVGFYDDDEVQEYPSGLKWLYPRQANFIAVVGNVSSRDLSYQYCQMMQKQARLACERFVLPNVVTGFEISDHVSYWKNGIDAVLITDTGSFRNNNRYRPEVEINVIQYEKMAALVDGLVEILMQKPS